MSGFQWADFVDVAARLHAAGTEADSRSAVSRAYYAAYHVVRKYVNAQASSFGLPAIPKKGHDLHLAVHERLRDMGNSLGVNGKRHLVVANNLKNLRTIRNDSDYEISKSVTKDISANAIENAREIIAQISNL